MVLSKINKKSPIELANTLSQEIKNLLIERSKGDRINLKNELSISTLKSENLKEAWISAENNNGIDELRDLINTKENYHDLSKSLKKDFYVDWCCHMHSDGNEFISKKPNPGR